MLSPGRDRSLNPSLWPAINVMRRGSKRPTQEAVFLITVGDQPVNQLVASDHWSIIVFQLTFSTSWANKFSNFHSLRGVAGVLCCDVKHIPEVRSNIERYSSWIGSKGFPSRLRPWEMITKTATNLEVIIGEGGREVCLFDQPVILVFLAVRFRRMVLSMSRQIINARATITPKASIPWILQVKKKKNPILRLCCSHSTCITGRGNKYGFVPVCPRYESMT